MFVLKNRMMNNNKPFRIIQVAYILLGFIAVSCTTTTFAFVPIVRQDAAGTRRQGFASARRSPLLASSSSSSSSSSLPSSSQVLEFREPTTGVNVKLIGTMHYNPASIKLAEDTISELAEAGSLASVVIETCEQRWDSSDTLNPAIKRFLRSEMKAAHDVAVRYGRPVVLGDQLINVTVASLKGALRDTIVQAVTPLSGGWKDLAANLTESAQVAFPSGYGYLGFGAFWNPQLLLAAPVTFLKYPASYVLRSPLIFVPVLVGLIFANDVASAQMDAMPLEEMKPVDILPSIVSSIGETLLFARTFFKELLADRNEILAKNILEQCQLYSKQKQSNNRLLSLPFGKKNVPYVKGTEPSFWGGTKVENTDEVTVVAVVGMAHCNGMKKLLVEDML